MPKLIYLTGASNHGVNGPKTKDTYEGLFMAALAANGKEATFTLDDTTPADGLCWYHGIVQQFTRADLANYLPQELKAMRCGLELKNYLNDWVMRNLSTLKAMDSFTLLGDVVAEQEYDSTVQNYMDVILRQRQKYEWVSSLHTQLTSSCLGVKIVILSSHLKTTEITPMFSLSEIDTDRIPTIHMAFYGGDSRRPPHYQSLILKQIIGRPTSEPTGVQCESCLKEFQKQSSLNKHITFAKKCKSFYGGERLQALKKQQESKRKRTYYEANKEKILQSKRDREASEAGKLKKKNWQDDYNKRNKESKRLKHEKYNHEHRDEINVSQANYNLRHREPIAEKQAVYAASHPEEMRHWKSSYNKKHRKSIAEKQQNARKVVRDSVTEKGRRSLFKEETKDGLSFVCCCCHRLLAKQSVIPITNKDMKLWTEKHGTGFLNQCLKMEPSTKLYDKFYLCCNCKVKVSKGTRPPMSVSNGLQLDRIPEELQLTDLENQLIAPRILFMKIKQLPKSRIGALVDRVIDVPIEGKDIEETLSNFPRMMSKSGIVVVSLKRMKSLKQSHAESLIRPAAIVTAVKKFKELDNPFYSGVTIPSNYEEELNNDILQCLQHDGEEATQIVTESDDENEDQDEQGTDAVTRNQVQIREHTGLVPDDPSSLIVMNQSNKTIQKTTNTSSSIEKYEIAPGEGKIPTNWLKDVDFEVMAFPTLFPTGSFGLFHARDVKLSCHQYFNQRLFNKDSRFSKNVSYLLMAEQFKCRTELEQQINVSAQKGVLSGGTIHFEDFFNVFVNIRGSPKYWQKVRNELLAKIEQLGPFHIFFTFSCGELRWSEVFVSLLRNETSVTIEYDTDENGNWTGEDDTILVNGQPLWEFVDAKGIKNSSTVRENVFHITRIFDMRVKSFVKNILMGSGSNKVPFSHFAYRVEFQARGKILLFVAPNVEFKYLFFNHILSCFQVCHTFTELLGSKGSTLKSTWSIQHQMTSNLMSLN